MKRGNFSKVFFRSAHHFRIYSSIEQATHQLFYRCSIVLTYSYIVVSIFENYQHADLKILIGACTDFAFNPGNVLIAD